MGLKDGSRVWNALGLDRGWSNSDHLQAHIVDALQGANWQRGGSVGKPPAPIARPSKQKAETDREEIRVSRARKFRERVRAQQATN